MDYRERKYYLIRFADDYNENLKFLKEEVPSLKVHPPYNHFKKTNHLVHLVSTPYGLIELPHYSLGDVHDGRIVGNVQAMVSVKFEDDKKFKDTIQGIFNNMHDGLFKSRIIELTKHMTCQ